jgi:hypothetical protein
MSKKKAAKLGLTAAVAASAFVAGNPADAAAATTVEQLVTNAEKAANQLKPFYGSTSLEVSAEFTAKFNAAKAAIAKAKAAKLNAAQAARVEHANELVLRAARYIDAVKVVNNELQPAVEELQAYIDDQEINDAAKAAYDNLSEKIRKAERVIGKVYGASIREAFLSEFVLPAKIAKETVIYEVSRFNLLNQIQEHVDKDQLKEAEEKIAMLERLEKRSIEIKEAGNKLHPGKYPELKEIETALVAKKEAVVKAYEEKLAPAVVSVSAINATQVVVKFNKAIDAASLFANGTDGAFKVNTISLTSIESTPVPAGTLSGKLSADGKTLTVTATNALSKRYNLVIDNLKSKDGQDLVKYDEIVTIVADTTAPTIVSTTKISASSFKVTFSEPIKDLGTVSYKLADGTVVAASANGVTNDFTPGAQEVTFTVGSDVAAGKEVIVTFIGAKDQADNLLTPNPATVSFVKGDKDGVAPTVTSITQTGAKTFTVKFSEQLLSAPTVKVNGVAATVEKDSTDPTQYKVTTATALDGATTVAISSFTDLSGEVGTDVSKVVTFVKDTAAPKVVSSSVVVDSTTNKQYLEVTFDKDVVLGTTPTVTGTGTFVKDYVTNTINTAATPVSYKDVNNKKVVRVELDSFLGDTTTDVEGAVYTLDLTFAGITSGADIAADTAKVSFTRGKDGVAPNTAVVAVTNVAPSADNNKVEVTFDKAVDGASATNVANYKIDGAIIESVTLKPFDTASGTQVAVLNLKPGSNTFTGTRNIYISGVKALGSSKVMNPYHTNTVSLKENVAPVVTSAKLTATDEITLTFSEAVTDNNGLDFEVLIGGQSQATAEKVDAGIGSTATTTVKVSINTIDATELAKGISLKALTDTLDIVDAAGNKLSVPANIVVSN